MNVYCRFESDVSGAVVDGIRMDDATISCISPPRNGASSAIISYAVFIEGCVYDANEVVWNAIDNDFIYDSDLAGVVLLPLFDFDYSGYENSRLLFSERQYTAEWSSKALFLSAVANYADISSLIVELEVLASIQDSTESNKEDKEDKEDAIFKVISSVIVPPEEYGSTKFSVESKDIVKSMYINKGYEGGIETSGVVIVRVVASPQKSNIRIIYATRTSKLAGILPGPSDNTKQVMNTYPVSLDTCDQEYVPLPCPPNIDLAENDFEFSPDETCLNPSGGGECSPTSDLEVDLLENCEQYEDHPDYDTFCGEIDFDTKLAENCDCNYFQKGAIGCVKNGQSQCCYSPSGGLIIDPNDGGGTRYCGGSGTANRLKNNVLPYIFCCKLNSDCDTYYTARPAITSENYVKPELSSYSFGDPHLESFDHINFDFNGYGEYIAFCGKFSETNNVPFNLENCKPNTEKVFKRRGTTSVHFRFTKLSPNHNGTATVEVAIEDSTFLKGKQSLSVVTSKYNRLDVYEGSDIVKFPKG